MIVDLFAGGGGMACVMRALGLAARHVEMDRHACDTLTAAGFGDVVCGDVRDPSWHPRERVDLLHGSPPCPVWSRANQDEAQKARAVDGWPWMLDAVRALRPTCVTVENVRGAPAAAWSRDLEALGYHVGAWLLDAADYGAAQRRVRWFIAASLVSAPLRPPATHGAPLLGLAPTRTLRECLDPQGDRKVYAPGTGAAASEPWRLDLPSPTVMCRDSHGTRAGAYTGWQVRGGPDGISDALFLALGWRQATVAECARAQGFPEGHPFRGPKSAHYKQAGNAVEHHVARAVLAATLATIGHPAR